MTNSTTLHSQEVLDKKRTDLLEYLVYFKDKGFILGGGTALALIFGHRISEDFDFFCENDFDTDKLFKECLEVFRDFEIVKIFEDKNTLYIVVNGVKISFFTYNYKAIGEIIKTPYFNIFSVDDISAMKLWAIQNRATNKDYVDLYYIIKENGLKETLENFFSKFGNIVTKSYLLKSLVYFNDIEEENLVLKDKNLDFEKVKKFLKNKVTGK